MEISKWNGKRFITCGRLKERGIIAHLQISGARHCKNISTMTDYIVVADSFQGDLGTILLKAGDTLKKGKGIVLHESDLIREFSL